jgi:phage FluMu protein Com
MMKKVLNLDTVKSLVHGTASAYIRGCRCPRCREANRLAVRAWRSRQPLSTNRWGTAPSRQMASEIPASRAASGGGVNWIDGLTKAVTPLFANNPEMLALLTGNPQPGVAITSRAAGPTERLKAAQAEIEASVRSAQARGVPGRSGAPVTAPPSSPGSNGQPPTEAQPVWIHPGVGGTGSTPKCVCGLSRRCSLAGCLMPS